MGISERKLRKWRKEALGLRRSLASYEKSVHVIDMGRETMNGLCERILRMSQELLDQHLMKK